MRACNQGVQTREIIDEHADIRARALKDPAYATLGRRSKFTRVVIPRSVGPHPPLVNLDNHLLIVHLDDKVLRNIDLKLDLGIRNGWGVTAVTSGPDAGTFAIVVVDTSELFLVTVD